MSDTFHSNRKPVDKKEDESGQCALYEDTVSIEFNHGEIIGVRFKPNSIASIPIQKIVDKFHLTYLSAPNNNLTKISEEIFSAFPYLNWLDLRNNKIMQFPKTIGHRYLGTILLGGNKIESLPVELGSFPELYCLQVSGNPLEFPEAATLERQGIDLVSYLKLCWKSRNERPQGKQKSRKGRQVARDENLLKVKHLGNVANVVTEKMKSGDPVDQMLASHVTKKMRDIDLNVQKTKDADLLEEWRKRHNPKKVGARETARSPPYDVDPELLTIGSHPDTKAEKNKRAPKKKPLKTDEDLEMLNAELDSIRAQRPAMEDPALEKAIRISDIRKMQAIMKKIRETDIMNP